MGCLHSSPLKAHETEILRFSDVEPTASSPRHATHRSANGSSNGNTRLIPPSKVSSESRPIRVGSSPKYSDTAQQPRQSSNGIGSEWARWEESGMGLSASKETDSNGLKAAIAAEGTKVSCVVGQPPPSRTSASRSKVHTLSGTSGSCKLMFHRVDNIIQASQLRSFAHDACRSGE